MHAVRESRTFQRFLAFDNLFLRNLFQLLDDFVIKINVWRELVFLREPLLLMPFQSLLMCVDVYLHVVGPLKLVFAFSSSSQPSWAEPSVVRMVCKTIAVSCGLSICKVWGFYGPHTRFLLLISFTFIFAFRLSYISWPIVKSTAIRLERSQQRKSYKNSHQHIARNWDSYRHDK